MFDEPTEEPTEKALSAADRKFVFDLIDKLEEYEQSGVVKA